MFTIGVWAWSLRNALAWRRLGREPANIALPATRTDDAVLVTGGTGFVGQALIAKLRADGRRVIVLTRDALQARAVFEGDKDVVLVENLNQIAPEVRLAGIVHLAGARVLGMPWRRARRKLLLESRTRITMELLALIRRLEQKPEVLVAASAVGYYGVPAPTSICDEDALPIPGVFQSDLCAAIEHEARRAESLGVRVVRLRFGLILGRKGGAYPMQALAARLGFGCRIGDGRQPLPWVHLDDAIGLAIWALENKTIAGAVNAVAPQRCDQREFVNALAASFGRRARLAVPAAPLRRLAGEMSTLLVDGQSVEPRRALQGGYRFRWEELSDALRALRA